MISEAELRNLLARVAAIVIATAGTGACSSTPGWVDPTTWVGGSDQEASDTSPDSTAADNAPTPDLASIPNKPAPPSTSDEQKQVSDTLAADRAQAQYSAEALKGGTEPSAPPPPAMPPAEASMAPEQSVSSAPAPVPSPSSTDGAAAQQTPAAPAEEQTAAVAPPDQSSASVPAPAPAQPATSPPPPAQQPAAQVASTQPLPPVAAPALPPPPVAASVSAGDAQLGFAASKAPPLDPSVSRYVPRTILDQYQRSSGGDVAPSSPRRNKGSDQSSENDRISNEHVAFDQRTDGIAGFAPGAARIAAADDAGQGYAQASYSPVELSCQISTVYFSGDTPELTGQAKAAVLAAAQAFAAGNHSRFVRVIGHSSSHASKLPAARRLEVIFARSQDYAAAVAQELVRDGVPADKVLTEAAGNSEPVRYESTSDGQAGNRRAEILM
jgi:outer membrane protein OmpA-like peptidoglycan-associated protein